MIQTFLFFFVREVWRGNGVLERSLKIAEMLRGEEDDGDRKPVCTNFGKRFTKVYLLMSLRRDDYQKRSMTMCQRECLPFGAFCRCITVLCCIVLRYCITVY